MQTNQMNTQGQGALEYLLLIGGAVLIAAVVIASLANQGGVASDVAEKRQMDALCAPLLDQTKCKAETLDSAGKWGCTWNVPTTTCVAETPPTAN